MLESPAERVRISARESCALEWFNRHFRIRAGKGFGLGTGGGRLKTNDEDLTERVNVLRASYGCHSGV
jgi:hypothetical protein